MVFADTQNLDVTLSGLASMPDPDEADPTQLEAPWCTTEEVDAAKAHGRIPTWRALVDINTEGRDFKRPLGHQHQEVVFGDPTWTEYDCEERSPAASLDNRQLDEADDALELETMTSKGLVRSLLLVRKKEIIAATVNTADLPAANTSTIAALGYGAPAVNFASSESLPFVSCRVICERLAEQNGGAWPHWITMDRKAAIMAITGGGRTSLPTDKKLREERVAEFKADLQEYLDGTTAVYLDNTIEAGNRRFGNKIVAGYSSKAIQTRQGVGFTRLNSLACVHAKFPKAGITGRMAIKRWMLQQNIGLGLAAMSAWDVKATDVKSRFVGTAAY